MIANPRVTFALAEQGDFPRWFSAIHRRYQTPCTSIVAFAVLLWGWSPFWRELTSNSPTLTVAMLLVLIAGGIMLWRITRFN